jgi:hypothetical protein
MLDTSEASPPRSVSRRRRKQTEVLMKQVLHCLPVPGRYGPGRGGDTGYWILDAG